jgi:hypothetical protein
MNSINFMQQITNNVDQCKRTSSFPVQVTMPSQRIPIYKNDNALSDRINSLPVQKAYDVCEFFKSDNSSSSNGFDIVSKNMEHTPVSSLFFSKTNIDALQCGLRNTVYNKSNGKHIIGKQSEIELKIVMRSIYYDYLRNGFKNMTYYPDHNPINNFDKDVLNTVRRLNGGVLQWCSKEILTNIQQFTDFKTLLQTEGVLNVMERPQTTNNTGLRNQN